VGFEGKNALNRLKRLLEGKKALFWLKMREIKAVIWVKTIQKSLEI
jgi:hypothetical protein